MERADEISWYGDAEERFLEKAAARDQWGKDNGNFNLGYDFFKEVLNKITEISNNVNTYTERDDFERVAPLLSNHVLVHKKEYFTDSLTGQKKIRLLILDVRKFY